MEERFFSCEFICGLADADIICFQSLYCDNNMTRYRKPFMMREGKYSDGKEVTSDCLKQHFGACLYAADLLKKYNICFDETLCYSEDILFFRKCIRSADRISLYNKPFYFYRNNVSAAVHTRNKGIEYYEPIFETYLANDEEGKGFVSWYIVDMIEEHFCYFGTIYCLKKWLDRNKRYISIAIQYGNNRTPLALEALEKYPRRFALKYYVRGLANRIIRMAIRLPGIDRVFERIKYPFMLSVIEKTFS